MHEHRGGACSEILVAAAEQGNLQALEFCWNMGLRADMFKALKSASRRGHWKVKNFFVDKVRNNCIYRPLCYNNHPASESDHMVAHLLIETPLRPSAERRRFGSTEAHRYLSPSLAEHRCPSRAAVALAGLAGNTGSERPLDPASVQERVRDVRSQVPPRLLPNEPTNELPHRRQTRIGG